MKKILIDPNVTLGELFATDTLKQMDYHVQIFVPEKDRNKAKFVMSCIFMGTHIYTNIPANLDDMSLNLDFKGIQFSFYTAQQEVVHDELMAYLRHMGIVAMSFGIGVTYKEGGITYR